GAISFEVRIDVMENLGGVSFAYARSDAESPFVIELKNRKAIEGGMLKTGFEPQRALLFDPQTELRIR
ncbi:MAG: ABC transporter ATP-binding protein, partial [Pararhizobium sp.]